MNKLLYILLFMLMAATVSCHRTSEAEARLIAIDSLIPAAPDSTLALLEAIDTASLRGEMRAYHALLTAQALYKAYIPATSDSLINRAWDYYKDHGSYDRRIRAMLYKATTAEELGHPDTAMYWYKRTELESRPDDHYHRGFSEMAMGAYYQDGLYNNIAISKYKSAVEEFEILKDTTYLVYCANELSKLYSLEKLDSTYYYNNKLLSLTKNPEEKQLYRLYLTSIIETNLFYDSCFEAAKDSALVILRNLDNPPKELYYHITESYYRIGNIDSALYYYHKCQLPENKKDSVLYFRLLSIINEKNSNWSNGAYYSRISNELGEEIIDEGNKTVTIYQQIERNQENSLLKNRHKKNIKIAICIIITLIIFVFVYIILSKLKRLRISHELKDLQIYNERLELINSDLEKSKNSAAEIVENQADTFKYLLTQIQKSMSENHNKDSYKKAVKRAFTTNYFSHLRQYVDIAHNGLATSMLESGKLEEAEINVICMYLSRLPNSVINLYTGHSSRQNAIRYRNNISKKYFGDKDKLKELME